MKISILVMLGVAMLLSTCNPTTGIYSNPETPVVVQNGSRFTIELASNATTGYSWDFGIPVDTNYLKIVKTYYNDPKSDIVGAGGIQGWVFEAVQPGSTSITLEYKRPWEVIELPVQTAVFNIEIQ